MTSPHHFPPELLQLLTDSIPKLCRSKTDVLDFFAGAGVPQSLIRDFASKVKVDRGSVTKYEMTRAILVRLNDRGDATLSARRQVLRRVVEFEDFSCCWPADRLEAEGLVARIRSVVNVKDSFTRMAQERDQEHRAHRADRDRAAAVALREREERAAVRSRLFGLFGETDAHRRGKTLEAVLNDVFRVYGMQVREAFARRADNGNSVVEQIDGAIVLDNHIYMVEMKWWDQPLGKAELAEHLVRLYGRADGRGIVISYSDYTQGALDSCREALQQRVITLCRLSEIVSVLDQERDLAAMLRTKINAATLEKRPWYPQ